nr:uncharacterized protein LOC117217596 [Megalopta genalis]
MAEDPEDERPNNVLLFRIAISNCFKSIAESVGQDTFSDILAALKSQPLDEHTIQQLHAAMIRELHDGMINDLEGILSEGSMEEALAKLAKLCADSSTQEEAWRPPGNVTLHLRSLDAQVMEEEIDLLAKRVNEIEEENKVLMKDISERRSKVSALHDTITRTLSRTPNAIELLHNRMEDLEKCLEFLDHE